MPNDSLYHSAFFMAKKRKKIMYPQTILTLRAILPKIAPIFWGVWVLGCISQTHPIGKK